MQLSSNSKVLQTFNWINWCFRITKTFKLSPHGGGIVFSDIFPGSISDLKITEQCGAVYLVEPEHEIIIMSDRGFSIQGLCAGRGVTLEWSIYVN